VGLHSVRSDQLFSYVKVLATIALGDQIATNGECQGEGSGGRREEKKRPQTFGQVYAYGEAASFFATNPLHALPTN
jgi:hypothetical protein